MSGNSRNSTLITIFFNINRVGYLAAKLSVCKYYKYTLIKFFKHLDVNFGLKCKCDLIVKNSTAYATIANFVLFLKNLLSN